MQAGKSIKHGNRTERDREALTWMKRLWFSALCNLSFVFRGERQSLCMRNQHKIDTRKESEISFRWSRRRKLNRVAQKRTKIPSIEIPQRNENTKLKFPKFAFKVARFYASYANPHEGKIDFHQIAKFLASRTRTKMKSSWRFSIKRRQKN